jgi:hypothetical protein
MTAMATPSTRRTTLNCGRMITFQRYRSRNAKATCSATTISSERSRM